MLSLPAWTLSGSLFLLASIPAPFLNPTTLHSLSLSDIPVVLLNSLGPLLFLPGGRGKHQSEF